ncbi:unnamed protein product [Angiostrongylus costaricensis]|uniref:RH2 domain-containing protein n=1 Tax=Angiostrongylus costaricensis TaxID=334426 RepID=A0A158PLT1_ANGCS|nr:unnamed protein product [Angiostrongylus costaricensis]
MVIASCASFRSRTKTGGLLRQRKELEEECKKLSNEEQNAPAALEMRLEELRLEYNKLEEEEARLKKEYSFNTRTPSNFDYLPFANITLRTLEMQRKLDEARKAFEQLEVMSTTGEPKAQAVLDNDIMNRNVGEDMDVNGIQEVSIEDFSDDDLDVEGAATEDDCTAVEEGNQYVYYFYFFSPELLARARPPGLQEFVIHVECTGSQTSIGSTAEEAVFHRSGDCVGTVMVSSKKVACQANSSTDEEATSSSNSSYDVLGVAPPSPCFGASQEIDAFLSTLLNRPPSPMLDEMPFTFSSDADDEEFDPTMLLNISSHSNDPGPDFSSLMEQFTNGGRERDRQSEAAECFSIFGASADVGSSGGIDGDFVFDIGNPIQCEDDEDNVFNFNFGGFSNDDSSSDKDDGFNFLGF